MPGFVRRIRFLMRLFIVPILLCAICALPGSAQYTAGHVITTATAPSLQGATMVTIGPQGADATYVSGLNTAGTVRVNNLANLEALLNEVTNGTTIVTFIWGAILLVSALICFLKERGGIKRAAVSLVFLGSLLMQGSELLSAFLSALLMRMDSNRTTKSEATIRFWLACCIIKISLLLPAMVNWLIQSVRDANLFS